MTPEPVEALVERVRLCVDAAESDLWGNPSKLQKPAQNALTELAERVKAATSEDFTLVPKDEYRALRERVKAAERERDAIYRQARLNIADAVEYRAQRDELVKALERIAEGSDFTWGNIARLALAKVRGEAGDV